MIGTLSLAYIMCEFNVAVVSVPGALSRLYENNMPAGAITSPDRRGEEHIDVG